tara:strand:- start:202 stop:603 length:402 start_codon:yes stop_codon:yes gene_type:complete
MVLPLIVGGVILIGGVWYAVDQTDGRIEEITEDAKDAFVETGVPILQSIGEGIGAGLETIGAGLAEIGEDLGSGALVVIRGAGRAVIDSGENMFDYIASKVSPHRVEAVTAITAMLFYGTTAVIIFKKIRGAN